MGVKCPTGNRDNSGVVDNSPSRRAFPGFVNPRLRAV